MATGTVGVITGGIDVIYPPENRALFLQIVDEGLLLAEMCPGTAPCAWGCGDRGSDQIRITDHAREAGERGNEVMAIPGSPLDPR